MSETAKHNADEPIYILYDPSNGRILGNYAKYDAEKGVRVQCDPKEVAKASVGASPELKAEGFEVLEAILEEATELKDLEVDPEGQELVPRKAKRSGQK
jgi:hypothetical protein